MAEDSEEWEFFLETLWELQCLKTRSELTSEIKKTFYEECQGITSVAVNLFILAQERALFDESNEDETITSRVLKKTAKEDMKIIQPMLNAIRKNDLKAMYKYEDIMINLDDLMINHKQNTEYEGRIKEAMKERQNTLQYKRQDTIGSLSVEVASLGIFDALNVNDIRMLVTKVVENQTIDAEFSLLKLEVVKQAIALNQKKKELKLRSVISDTNILPLLSISKKAKENKVHPYKLLKSSGYIKNIQLEFY